MFIGGSAMMSSLEGRSLLTLLDYTPEEINLVIETATALKKERELGKRTLRFQGRTLALLFEKRSTRTRCAFETAFGEEGGHPVFLSNQDIHLGEKESIEDTARVLGRMFDAIQFRGFHQKTVETLAEYSGVPVYNGLTDSYHPTQALADLLTIRERFSNLEGIKLCYVGDGRNNVARSLAIAGAKMGMHLTIASPPELLPSQESTNCTKPLFEASGGSLTISTEVSKAVEGAEVIYTDVWTSMGEEAESSKRERLLSPFQVNRKLMEQTGNPVCVFLHCLPAVKGKEVTAEVIDGSNSAAWDQAENRKHTIKALMALTIGQ